MPKFFAAAGEEASSDEEVEVEEVAPATLPSSSKFMKGDFGESSEEEEDVVRVVKSAKEKLMDELEATYGILRRSRDADDWNAVFAEYQKLMGNQNLAKYRKKEGNPRPFIRCLVMLEDCVTKVADNKEQRMKMSATNSKSLNKLKQQLRKNNAPFKDDIDQYRKNPDRDDSDDEQDMDDDRDGEEDAGGAASGGGKAAASGFFFAAGGDDAEDDEGDDDESSDDDAGMTYDSGKGSKSDKWKLKEEDKVKKVIPEAKAWKKKKDVKEHAADSEAEEEEEAAGAGEATAEGEKKEETRDDVTRQLKKTVAIRGKKGYDRRAQIEKLQAFLPRAKDTPQTVEVMVEVVAAQFDVVTSMATHMPVPLWKSAADNLKKILDLLAGARFILMVETEEEAVRVAKKDKSRTPVVGSLLAFFERLDDEFIKSLQFIDPHTTEYVERLTDEATLLELAESIQLYYARNDQVRSVARTAIRRIEHLYYKSTGDAAAQADVAGTLAKLCGLIYSDGDDRMKARAMLCNIYNHAICDHFFEARDMMLMSHLQESVVHMDVPTQILFNRTMVQLGLCAFRKGLIHDAHSCLSELYSGSRVSVKELLAQGFTNTRYQDKSQEQEKLERRRQVPYHMHINLELLECVHYICAMLLEVPSMAANAFDVKRKIISKPFRRLLDYLDRAVFNGPPENTRDYVIAASKHLMKGNWKKCAEQLLDLAIWGLIPNSDQVKAMLRRRIQEEGLRTFLFSYSQFYESLSLDHLATMFELPANAVHSLISKMMISEELHASWDQPTSSIIMHRVEPTRLQSLCLQFTEKAASYLEANERLYEPRQGYDRQNNPNQKPRLTTVVGVAGMAAVDARAATVATATGGMATVAMVTAGTAGAASGVTAAAATVTVVTATAGMASGAT
eukprot:CAMPEP_0177656464 /NCGR_PEP_ID=MMETSP0447-20121125/15585_1 /TAXON_ID=0 /ORGANISM="Stygamoeba regulata, Strain BSH-02190019" /LENGTH=900 /DNA_ID=CAMNT_0019160593 /DNA_START=75 /DNA_END=2774 /DNA_ORIENTATION=-